MAGAGRRTFQPGEVLTASNVNSYLMDQSVMRFASSAARGSAVGTAVIAEGMVSYLDDTNVLEVYDGSVWNPVYTPGALPVLRGGTGGTTVAQAQDNLGIGLVPIVAPTVNFSGGTATANSLGKVTFTGVTSFSLNNVFSNNYSAYRILYEVTSQSTGGATHNLRLRSSGTDAATNYSYGIFLFNDSTTQRIYSATTFAEFAFSVTTGSSYHVAELFNPFAASKTWAITQKSYEGNVALNPAFGGFVHTTATSYDGFTIYMSGGSVTGAITVYGYNT